LLIGDFQSIIITLVQSVIIEIKSLDSPLLMWGLFLLSFHSILSRHVDQELLFLPSRTLASAPNSQAGTNVCYQIINRAVNISTKLIPS